MSLTVTRRSVASAQRSSSRISSLEINRTLDESTRKQRRDKQLDGLEQDNSHDDPHANIVWNKAAPRFADDIIAGPSSAKKPRKSMEGNTSANVSSLDKARKRRMSRPEFNKQRFKKTFAVHVSEQSRNIAESSDPDFRRIEAYDMATAPPSYRPPRKFCAVCGFLSKYCCTRCGTKYCSLPCRDIHNDTRCMKWMT